jgi:hypothetical protein
MAKELGQEPVQVPHWIHELIMSRIGAKVSGGGADAVSDICSMSIFSDWFIATPFI